MFDGFRNFAIAFGLVFFVSLGQAQEQAQKEQRQPAAQQQPTQTFPAPLPVEIVSDEASTEASQRREAETRQHEKDDLVAQQGMNLATQAMNRATQRMAEYAFWSTIFVGVGTVLLIWTLWLTNKANKAAQTAVKVTRDIGMKQLRPWVLSDYLKHGYAPNPTIDGVAHDMGILFQPQWKNSGQSPAINANIYSESTIVETGDTLPQFPTTPMIGTIAIAAGFTAMGNPKAVGGADYDRFIKREIDFILFSRVDYCDPNLIDNPHFSEATFRCKYNGEQVDKNGNTSPNISISPEGAQNTAT